MLPSSDYQIDKNKIKNNLLESLKEDTIEDSYSSIETDTTKKILGLFAKDLIALFELQDFKDCDLKSSLLIIDLSIKDKDLCYDVITKAEQANQPPNTMTRALERFMNIWNFSNYSRVTNRLKEIGITQDLEKEDVAKITQNYFDKITTSMLRTDESGSQVKDYFVEAFKRITGSDTGFLDLVEYPFVSSVDPTRENERKLPKIPTQDLGKPDNSPQKPSLPYEAKTTQYRT